MINLFKKKKIKKLKPFFKIKCTPCHNRIGSGTWIHIQPPKITKKQITKLLLNSHTPSRFSSLTS
ncbi:unnamed protein product, partial [Vitis vinifera]